MPPALVTVGASVHEAAVFLYGDGIAGERIGLQARRPSAFDADPVLPLQPRITRLAKRFRSLQTQGELDLPCLFGIEDPQGGIQHLPVARTEDGCLCASPAAGGHRKADYLQAIADDGEPHLASGIIEAGPHPDRERRTAASGRGPLFVAPGSGRRARRRLAAGPANNRGSVMIKATPIR